MTNALWAGFSSPCYAVGGEAADTTRRSHACVANDARRILTVEFGGSTGRPEWAVDGDELAGSLGLFSTDSTAPRHHVALVGGGGKTTLMHAIGAALQGPTVLTCTTKMGADQHRGHRVLIDPDDHTVLANLRIERSVIVLADVVGPKGVGISAVRADELYRLGVHVVAEADGSRRRPAKAPLWYEPVLASTATMVICVIGIDALNAPIEQRCHRPDQVAAVLGCSTADLLTPARAVNLVTGVRGGRKDVPIHAEFVVCLTKVTAESAPVAERFVTAVRDLGVTVRAVTHVDGW